MKKITFGFVIILLICTQTMAQQSQPTILTDSHNIEHGNIKPLTSRPPTSERNASLKVPKFKKDTPPAPPEGITIIIQRPQFNSTKK